MKTIRIRALIFQDSGLWCAQCLEHDVAVQATSVEKLLPELIRVLTGYLELAIEANEVPFAGFPAAPRQFFEMFEKCAVEPPVKLLDPGDAPRIVPTLRYLQPQHA